MRKRGFFDRSSGLTVARILALTGATCADAGRLSWPIADVAPLDLAGPNDLSFIEAGDIIIPAAVRVRVLDGDVGMPAGIRRHVPLRAEPLTGST